MAITPEKARKILKDGEVSGEALTRKQRRFFHAVANREKQKSAIKRKIKS